MAAGMMAATAAAALLATGADAYMPKSYGYADHNHGYVGFFDFCSFQKTPPNLDLAWYKGNTTVNTSVNSGRPDQVTVNSTASITDWTAEGFSYEFTSSELSYTLDCNFTSPHGLFNPKIHDDLEAACFIELTGCNATSIVNFNNFDKSCVPESMTINYTNTCVDPNDDFSAIGTLWFDGIIGLPNATQVGQTVSPTTGNVTLLPGSGYGESTAISSGDRMVVGAPLGGVMIGFGRRRHLSFVTTSPTFTPGFVFPYSYVRGNDTWIPDLVVGLGSGTNDGDMFGKSVALNNAGDRFVAGAPGGNYVSVYDFNSTAGRWDLERDIPYPNPSIGTEEFGFSVAIDFIGDVIAVGAPGRNEVWTFNLFGSGSGERITGTDRFGESVSLQYDGEYLAAGAPGSEQACAYERTSGAVFVPLGPCFNGTDFGGSSGDRFGASVSIVGPPNALFPRVAVGAPENDDGGMNAGKVQTFQYLNGTGTWEQYGDDVDGQGDGAMLGTSVRIDQDFGTRIIAGAPGFSPGNMTDAGKVRILDLKENPPTGEVWLDACNEVIGENAMDLWGTSVDTKDGFRFIAGAPGSGTGNGTARVFDCPL